MYCASRFVLFVCKCLVLFVNLLIANAIMFCILDYMNKFCIVFVLSCIQDAEEYIVTHSVPHIVQCKHDPIASKNQ